MCTEYGLMLVFCVDEVEELAVDVGWVIVKVAVVGVNMVEWHFMVGELTFVWLLMGFPCLKKMVFGEDVVGVVVFVGLGVMRFAVGDEVFGLAGGLWAEFACAKEEFF